MREFEILIASIPSRDNVVAEIWYKGNIIAQINLELANYYVNTFNCKHDINIIECMEILQKALKKLKG